MSKITERWSETLFRLRGRYRMFRGVLTRSSVVEEGDRGASETRPVGPEERQGSYTVRMKSGNENKGETNLCRRRSTCVANEGVKKVQTNSHSGRIYTVIVGGKE